jgi:3-ketosteroid 9alpha-monooxygenase subunit B
MNASSHVILRRSEEPITNNQLVGRSSPTRQITKLEAIVCDVVKEAPDTATLVLFTGNERLDYQPGHFLTIEPHQFHDLDRFTSFLEDLKGKKEPPRAYSMSSAPNERYLTITVKEERYISGTSKYPPLLSPFLVHRIRKGARLVITGFTGPYTLSDDIVSRNECLVHICAGSGSVPNLSILKHSLEFHSHLRHIFIYSTRTWNEVIFRNQLAELSARYPDRLSVIHTLTREKDVVMGARHVRHGRVDLNLLREVLPESTACHFFVCGPAISTWDRAAAREKGEEPLPRFLESVLADLARLGIPKGRITRESYG